MNPDPDGRIKVEARDHLLLIAIDRAEKRNGFTPKMLTELAMAYATLENDPELRCGVLYGEGQHFTAGLDLPKVAPLRREGRPLFPSNAVDPCNLREPLRTKPLVVAVQGICFTLGLELLLAADIAVAADDCRFSQLEVKRGIMASCGATFRIMERSGWGNAMKVLLTGEEFSAAEAHRCNLVQEVVPHGEQLPRAIQIAAMIARQAPLAVQATMENARTALAHGWQAAALRIAATQLRLYGTRDAQEGIQSFVEKREARFTGR